MKISSKSKNKIAESEHNFTDEVAATGIGLVANPNRKMPSRKNIEACQDSLQKKIKAARRRSKKKETIASSFYSEKHVIMRTVYKFVSGYLNADEGDLLTQKANGAGVMSKTRPSTNAFNTGFLILTPNNVVSSQNRFRYSRQLSYAYEHGIKPKWLMGFLAQAGGGDQAAAKYDAGEYEKWLNIRSKHPLRPKTGTLL